MHPLHNRLIRLFGIVVLIATGAVSTQAAAQSATSRAQASAEIITNPPSVISLRNFEVGIRPQSIDAIALKLAIADGKSPLLRTMASDSLMKTAQFAISGEPGQIISLRVSDQATARTPAGIISFSALSHDAGPTPVIGEDGRAQINIGAGVRMDLDFDPDAFSPAAGKADIPEQAQRLRPQRQGSPFAFDEELAGYLSLMVSYN